jgi:hypothetical protein
VSDTLTAAVYMNRGWWVADCPRPFCHHAEYFGVAMNGAGVGGLHPEYMMCGGCSGAFPAAWPDTDMRRGVEQLLGLRPDTTNRNWYPTETLSDLLWENTMAGITPSQNAIGAAREQGGGMLLSISGGEVTQGFEAIQGGTPRLALPGGQ